MYPKGMDVWLIRHGESTANAGARGETPAGTELTALGHQQARQFADQFPVVPARVVISSFSRTQQTAEPSLAKWGLTAETWQTHEWTFLNPDRYVGTTQAERGPAVRAYVERNDPASRDGGGAESFHDFMARVDDTVARLEACASGPVVLFTHGRFIQGLLYRLFLDSPRRPEMREFWKFSDGFPIANTQRIGIRHVDGVWHNVAPKALIW